MPTPYEQLWQTHQEERQRQLDYQKDGVEFAAEICDAFAKFLQCPDDRMKFYVFDEDKRSTLDSESRAYKTPKGAMRIRDDGRLACCLVLEMAPLPDPNADPKVITIGSSRFSFQAPVYVTPDSDEALSIEIAKIKASQEALMSTQERLDYFTKLVKLLSDYMRDSYKRSGTSHRIGF